MHTTSMHMASDAVPGLFRSIRRTASMPRGVAALPSPSRLADTLAEMLSITPRSPDTWGNRTDSTGRSSRDSPSARPERRMISMTPVHRHSMPAMDTHSSTAAWVPSTAAAATCSPRPVARPHRMDRTAIPVQIHAIVIQPAPSRPIYTEVISGIIPNFVRQNLLVFFVLRRAKERICRFLQYFHICG